MMRRLIIKKNKFLSAVIMFLILILSIPSINAEASYKESIKGVAAIVFYLKNARLERTKDYETYEVCSDNYPELAYSSGSGFFIGEDDSESRYIVTNCHVVEDFINSGNGGKVQIYWDEEEESKFSHYFTYLIADSCELRVYFDDDDYETASVECYGDVDAVDLAVLKLDKSTDKRQSLTIKKVTSDMVGDKIYTIGYPGNAENLFTDASKYGLSDVTLVDGIISKFVRSKESNVERIQVTAAILHGNSGGPLVDEDGNVLGVNTNVFSQSPYQDQIETNYYSISSNELINFLDSNDISYKKYEESNMSGEPGITLQPVATGEPEPTGDPDITGEPGITEQPAPTEIEDDGDTSQVPDPNRVTDEPDGGNGVPDIVKPDDGQPDDSSKPEKDSKSSDDDDDDDKKSSDNKSSEEGSYLGLIIGICAFAVLATVILILVIRSMKKDKNREGDGDDTDQGVGQTQKLMHNTPVQATVAQTVPIAAANNAPGGKKQKTGVLRLMTPQHNGGLVPIDMNPVLIGRDTSCCTVTFQDETPGVSAKHCQISYSASENEFTLVDLGSTYGTYIIKTRSRLDPNVPVKLKPGDSFVLGDKTNVITLDVAKSM